mmetsp:Transcript_9782/g.34080  ORF Transcript_9782/g.34080 Transcript_9782/m.34080 type:complete len:146 (+) Transcript_9782:150-587(+)
MGGGASKPTGNGTLVSCADVGDLKQFKVLWEASSDADQKTGRGGKNLLHIAALCGHAGVVQFLLAEKAYSVDAFSEEGNTALHYACVYGHPKVATMLLDAGAQLTMRNSKGMDCAQLAGSTNSSELKQILAKRKRLSGGAVAMVG